MQLVPFLEDEIFLKEISKVLSIADKASEDQAQKLFKNSIDPFSAVFDAARQHIPLSLWLEFEKVRQGQKTLQNKLGEFHQAILGNVSGWENLGTGNLIDVKNDTKKIIAEIKNKHNTTKGSDKISIYDNLKFAIKNKYKGYIAYYVEVIPKNKNIYDKEFVPSDNKTKSRRREVKNIRVIDGKSFYALATGIPDVLLLMYKALPKAIGQIMNIPMETILNDNLFLELFEKSYNK
ncbi:MAG: type II restriction enzyme (Eco47II, Sau96I) [uncultured bacterium]|nr:MAG: type II restriction enzyme (Eco47II, Sau96I) [uncultured bacterium]